MTTFSFECLRTYHEFQSIRDDWEEFTRCNFPESYGRSHPWLSAHWSTYSHGQTALIYVQRKASNGRMVAVAPLLVKREVFGGFPILALQSLGVGIGRDEFLIGQESRGFVDSVFADLVKYRRWHVAKLRRIRSSFFLEEIARTCNSLGCRAEVESSRDYCIDLPPSYSAYLQSRTRKFRRNMNQAANRIQKEGALTTVILDPYSDCRRVEEYGTAVAKTSWQFQDGKSHFNNNGYGTFYSNLANAGQRTRGEEFVVLLISDRPVAFLLGCLQKRTYYAVDTAYRPDYSQVSVGRILFGGIIERLITQGLADVFDFEGSGDYKDDYATAAIDVNALTIYNHSPYSKCIRLLRKSRLYSALRRIRNRPREGETTDA
jgi:CelD/BcsL family acetyltransferase involved in cellulose biosynthesis